MPRFSKHFKLGLSQHQLDFVDVNTDRDLAVYVDPYAIEVHNDVWATSASERIRAFFKEVLDALRSGDRARATGLMSHLNEPKETFLGVSRGRPKGRGVGQNQAAGLIRAILNSPAFKTGLLEDLSEMSLYVEGVDKDKVSDLTTNVIRDLLVTYTAQQCEIYGIPISDYNSPPLWDMRRKDWISKMVQLPYVGRRPVILVPKYIVRRKLSLDSQEFYNKQITDFLVAENLRAGTSLVKVIKNRDGSTHRKVFKSDVREANPKSKPYIVEMIVQHPELLQMLKDVAKAFPSLVSFDEDTPPSAIAGSLIPILGSIKPGQADASKYHHFILGALTILFYPQLIQPHKEWDVHGGRKRIDIVYTNAADTGFFGQRRDDPNTLANTVIVECKNYWDDIGNPEFDQMLGRFDHNRGRFGIIVCRAVKDTKRLKQRQTDASSRGQGYVLVLTDHDIVRMLEAKSRLEDKEVEHALFAKYRQLLE